MNLVFFPFDFAVKYDLGWVHNRFNKVCLLVNSHTNLWTRSRILCTELCRILRILLFLCMHAYTRMTVHTRTNAHTHAFNKQLFICVAVLHLRTLRLCGLCVCVCVCKRSYKHVILLKLSFFPLHPHSHPHFSFLQRGWDFQAAQMERVVVAIVQMMPRSL